MPKAGERKRDKAGRGSARSTVLLNLLRGGALGFAVACAVLFLVTYLIYSGVLGSGRGDSAVIAACLLGGFIGGVFAVVGQGKKAPLLLGLGTGGVLCFMLLMTGCLVYDVVPEFSSAGATACACLCGGGLSGFVGGADKNRRRK